VCGRFVSTSPPDEIAKYFGATEVDERLEGPNYNVAPTQDVYAVLENGGVRRVESLHWGLIPFWAKEAKIGNKMINARAETIATSGAFKHAFKKRRCIIPVDGFYEWKATPGEKRKQPYFIHRLDGEPLAFAGLWETWRGPDRQAEQTLYSSTIITTTANETMSPIHDRMPVILPLHHEKTWLPPNPSGMFIFPSFPSELMTAYPVTPKMNKATFNEPAAIAPLCFASRSGPKT
jgi:putative SOS response-associated peptidase YedK